MLTKLFLALFSLTAIGQTMLRFAPNGSPITDADNFSYVTSDGYKIEKQNGVYQITDAAGLKVIDTTTLVPAYLGNGFFCLSESGAIYRSYIYKGDKKLTNSQVELYYSGFVNDLLKVRDSNKKFYLINQEGNVSKPYDFIADDYEAIRATVNYKNENGYPRSNGFLIDRKTLIDKALPYTLNFFTDGLAQTSVDGKEAYAGTDGSIVIPGMKKIKVAFSFYEGLAQVKDMKDLPKCIDKTGQIVPKYSCFDYYPNNVNGLIIAQKNNYELYLKTPYFSQETKEYRYDKESGIYGYNTVLDFLVIKNASIYNPGYEILNYKGQLLAKARNFDVDANLGHIISNSAYDSNGQYCSMAVDRDGKIILSQPDSMMIDFTNGIFVVSKKPTLKVDAPSPSEKQMCVAFVMRKVSSGFGTRSITYACKYVVVTGTTSPDEAVKAATAKGYNSDSNGYSVIQTITDKSLKNLKSFVKASYVLSDFVVDYVAVE